MKKKTKGFVFTGKIDHIARLIKQIQDRFGKRARLGDVIKAIKKQ